MSYRQDQPPPLPPRSPALPARPRQNQQQPQPQYVVDDVPAVLGSFKESWRQIKASLGSEPQPFNDTLKPPALPPRPASPSARSPESAQTTTTQRQPVAAKEMARDSHPRDAGDGITDEIDELLKELTVSSDAQSPSPEHTKVREHHDSHAPAEDPLLPTHEELPEPHPTHHSSTTPADPSPLDEPVQPETCCISAVMTFPTTWYFHPNAPDVPICSRCYKERLQNTRFSGHFEGRYLDDNMPRMCKFSTLRIRERLLKDALATGSVEPLTNHMNLRAKIPDCKGINGAKGSEGTKWYLAKDNAIPGLVVCQACWEDYASVYSFSANFEENMNPQGDNDIWACDLAIPYIRKQYEKRSRAGDWPGFVAETSARLRIPHCPKADRAPRNSRKWFCPKEYPLVLICAACFCDQILGSGEEGNWHDSDENQTLQYSDKCLCALGLFHMTVAMSFAQDRKDYSIFWNALKKAVEGPSCEPEGIKGAVWYTLKSNPQDFGVCGVCYVSIIESMGMAKFFVPKTGIHPDLALRCCLHPQFPRFPHYLQKLLESYYTQSTATLESFAADYAHLPLCRRKQTFKHGTWYGWPDCTICPECHHEFIRGTALEASMPLQATVLEAHTMCQMYSPRMRTLYQEACAATPPDPTALIAFGGHRIRVYIQTVMVIEQIIVQQQLAVEQQKMLNGQSLFYTSLGNAEALTMGSTHSWGAAGVGYGFENQNQLQGAIYGKQARDVASTVGGSAMLRVAELERQWMAVE